VVAYASGLKKIVLNISPPGDDPFFVRKIGNYKFRSMTDNETCYRRQSTYTMLRRVRTAKPSAFSIEIPSDAFSSGDLEWYDPDGVSTVGGNLVFNFTKQETHNLQYRVRFSSLRMTDTLLKDAK
jgi:hypothetical protein